MPLRVVLIVGVVGILGGLVYVLSQSGYDQTGSNATQRAAFVAVVPAGGTVCEGPELVPAKTGRIDMLIGTYGHPGKPLTLTLRNPGGQVVATGGLRAGWKEGDIAIPLRHALAADAAPLLCWRSAGRVAIGGVQLAAKDSLMRVDGKRVGGRLSLTFQEGGKTSGWDRIGTIASRVGGAHLTGAWIFWAGVLLCAGAVGGAIVLLARTARREEP